MEFISGLLAGGFAAWAIMRKRAKIDAGAAPAADDLLAVTSAFDNRLKNVEKIMGLNGRHSGHH